MAISRQASRFNVRSDALDNITPNNIHQRDISAPAGEWKPAPWLPIQFKKTSAVAGTDAFVVSSGKVVAQDAQGFLVPAGLRLAMPTGGLTYTADDYEWGVIDITTGERYAVNGTTNYGDDDIAGAIMSRGLLVGAAVHGGNTAAPLTGTQSTEVIEAFISEPVGIAAYDFHVYAGRPEDGDEWFTNYSKQHLVQFLTEAQMIVPNRVAALIDQTGAAGVDFTDALVTTYAAGVIPADEDCMSVAGLRSLTRFAGVSATAAVVGIQLNSRNAAAITDRTPVTCDAAGILVRKRSSIDAITVEGDYFFDADAGILVISSAAFTTNIANTQVGFTYYAYAADGASAHRYTHFDGFAKPGDKVEFDAQSNLVPLTTGESIGRVNFIVEEPRGLLGQVKTAFNLTGMPAGGAMPGSATKGFSDRITLSQETIADRSVVVLVRF